MGGKSTFYFNFFFLILWFFIGDDYVTVCHSMCDENYDTADGILTHVPAFRGTLS